MTIYLYRACPAIFKSPKQLPNYTRNSRKTHHFNRIHRCPLSPPNLLGPWLNNSEGCLTPLLVLKLTWLQVLTFELHESDTEEMVYDLTNKASIFKHIRYLYCTANVMFLAWYLNLVHFVIYLFKQLEMFLYSFLNEYSSYS